MKAVVVDHGSPLSTRKHDIHCHVSPAATPERRAVRRLLRSGRLREIQSFRVDEHEDVAKIATKVAGESAYVNNFLFFAAESLPKVRHLIERR